LVRVTHSPNYVFGTDVLVVEIQLPLRGEFVSNELTESVQHHCEDVGLETGSPYVA
jgi:hypothetical protein